VTPRSALVTAVITTHSRPESVYGALDSLLAETYPNVEILLVDDAGTFQPASPIAARTVRVLHSGMRGVAGARNAGLAAAAGEFVVFLDDDDVALPGRIATLVDAASRHGADLAFGRTRRVAESGAQRHDVPTAVVPSDDIGLCDILTCAPHVNSVLVRTSSLRAVGGFDTEAAHFDDWAAWIRLADGNARICSVRDVVAEWRLHDSGLSGKVLRIRAMRARILALFDHLSTRLLAHGVHAIATARRMIANSDIETYDDYADAMATARETLHAAGRCIGPRSRSHELRGERRQPHPLRHPDRARNAR
jgi:glycosyltransferase involved in cell wall biosynthesis